MFPEVPIYYRVECKVPKSISKHYKNTFLIINLWSLNNE